MSYVQATPTGAGANASAATRPTAPLRDPRPNFNPLRRFAETGPVGGSASKSEGPIDGWTRLAHALFQTHEAVYYN